MTGKLQPRDGRPGTKDGDLLAAGEPIGKVLVGGMKGCGNEEG